MLKQSLELDHFLPYHLAVAADHISRSLAKVYASYDITPPEWRILVHLQRHGTLAPSELVSLTDMDKARVSRALVLMHRKELIARITNNADKRIVHIHLTLQGLSLYQDLEPDIIAWNQRLGQELPDGHYTQLLQQLKHLVACLNLS